MPWSGHLSRPCTDSAFDLLDLAIRVLHETFNLKLFHNIPCVGKPLVLDQDERLARPALVLLCDRQILLVRLYHESRIFLLLPWRLGLAAFPVLCPRTAPQGMGDMRMRRLTCLTL